MSQTLKGVKEDVVGAFEYTTGKIGDAAGYTTGKIGDAAGYVKDSVTPAEPTVGEKIEKKFDDVKETIANPAK